MSYFQKKHSNQPKYYCSKCNFYGTVWEIIAHDCKPKKKEVKKK